MSTGDKNDPQGRPLFEAVAAREIGLSRRLMRRAIDDGDIYTVKFAGRRWVPYAEVERLKALMHDVPMQTEAAK